MGGAISSSQRDREKSILTPPTLQNPPSPPIHSIETHSESMSSGLPLNTPPTLADILSPPPPPPSPSMMQNDGQPPLPTVEIGKETTNEVFFQDDTKKIVKNNILLSAATKRKIDEKVCGQLTSIFQKNENFVAMGKDTFTTTVEYRCEGTASSTVP